jgi:hypothetical protein
LVDVSTEAPLLILVGAVIEEFSAFKSNMEQIDEVLFMLSYISDVISSIEAKKSLIEELHQ